MTEILSQVLRNRDKKLITFITGGDPDLATSNQIIEKMITNNIDIIEIGMPFSDPMADGPTIQASSNRALQNSINLDDIFKLAYNAKSKKSELPIILMGYYNVILNYGIKSFVQNCVANGVDGLIIVDLQPEEDDDLIIELKKNNLDLIRLITPTTDENRLKLILKNASGFLYYVTVMGTTGQKSADISELEKSLKFIKQHTSLPIIPGFGIKDANDVKNICRIADGAVVGSSIIKIVEENLENKELMLDKIDSFTKQLKLGTKL